MAHKGFQHVRLMWAYGMTHFVKNITLLYFPSVVAHENPTIETRQSSTVPKSDKQGLLEVTSIFCGKTRKKTKGRT